MCFFLRPIKKDFVRASASAQNKLRLPCVKLKPRSNTMPHVAPCIVEIYLRPILGHTPRKLPLRASPQSNLSLHRISSPIIIQHPLQNCNSFFIFFMTILNELFMHTLCMLHNFWHYFGFFSPLCHSLASPSTSLAAFFQPTQPAFLCILIKARK